MSWTANGSFLLVTWMRTFLARRSGSSASSCGGRKVWNESIARQGFFSGDFVALEVALKDSERFDDGWAYFDLGKDRASAAAKPSESCHGCHAAHGADDNVFVQFYPVLRGLSRVSLGSPPVDLPPSPDH